MSTATSHDDAAAGVAPAFGSILCGFNGCRPASEAARQAAALAAPGGRVELLAITWHEGTGPTSRATIATAHLSRALADAKEQVIKLGAQAVTATAEAQDVAEALLARAADHDLLAVGCHCSSRAQGMLFGSNASAALHRAPTPVLIARRPPAPAEFPRAILVALAPDGCEQAVTEAAVRIARAHHARTAIMAPRDEEAPGSRAAVDAAVEALAAATGTEPVRLPDGAPAHQTIPHAAAEFGASLIVMGSRALAGVHALGSVSERVAHTAPCSVLVMRPPAA